MPTPLAELAQLVSGQLRGVGTTPIHGFATLDVAQAGEITLVDNSDRAAALEDSPAVAAIVPAVFPESTKPTIVVSDVHAAFAQIVTYFRPLRKRSNCGMSPSAWISPTARLAGDVQIHPGATIGDEVIIGSGSIVHSGARIMAGCVIGKGTTLFPNVVLYEDTHVGDRVILHAGAVLGAYGFGYREIDGQHTLASQLGNVVIEDDVEIGACATIDRGTYGATTIGAGTKIDNLVQIAHNCRLGQHNLICSQVGIAGSTTTGDRVVMAGQVGVRDHVHIGDGAVLCSKAGVPNSVSAGEVMLGQPATPLRRQKLQMAAIAKLPEMRRDFRQLQHQLAKLQEQLVADNEEQLGEQAA
ncbi:UDP-3-O-(3-hydroxymyristoyl)glucosamine N-acyltransferase [Bythopirellula goksoeyrii]|uniref:UDP-3-O-acylglucosamine N-acyltransferase n=1 Tax=Bythopirellula goksoeyrii TaxID=1400387 RepID=A0A5B9QAS0_9BACT|nr:UDP-3-O-(3-hydroxymyristoyl)glucosamine N-acyltransferase [Bythopirellula goksoeyrii]QEG34849.1 UDP-3-O-acylglucosamine N-acyltransferase [Bythopirellula goksoeyrii]